MVSHRNGRRDWSSSTRTTRTWPPCTWRSPTPRPPSSPTCSAPRWCSASSPGCAGTSSGGLLTEQVAIPAGSGYAGRRLGDTKARARTGASIVAVVRDGDMIASPAPSFRFEAGDSVVVVGTRAGVDGVTAILAESDPDS